VSVPTVVTVIQGHRAALLARESAAMAEQARRWLGVEQALQSAIDATALELATTGMTTPSQMMRSRRWINLMAQTRDELRKYENYIEPRIANGQRDMINFAIQHSAQAIDAIATEAQIVVPFNRLPVSAVESMVGLAGDGSPLRAVLDDAVGAGADAMGQQLINGIALGRNPVEVARTAIRLGLGQSFTRMQAISRSEMLRVYRTTTLESYAASRVIEAYRRLSARDSRVCPACLFTDGNIYPIDYGFDSHVNCRCTTIPVLRDVAPIRYQTGQEWFRTQPEATQRGILGPGRFEAWQSGRASLSDMVSRDWSDVWGGSLRVTRVRDLG
jgi:SPP1 gp7 family putative phage head morphogenesis protein